MGITKYIGKQFGKPSGFGGKISTFIMNLINQKQYRGTEAVLKLADGEAVLDIGFGNGYFIGELASKTDSKFYGIEISEDMIDIASKRNQRFIQRGT